eukprot:TRINITY_DN15487_c0_g1_i2.p1 TRINITY_DN15487_c0_g1~~TRINITY_DN15487_c0_g1_i2.p1  ORF type:complete len:622 (-),score=58.55 TRINITY_DN15487_c0_g1_i2:256-2121(-)
MSIFILSCYYSFLAFTSSGTFKVMQSLSMKGGLGVFQQLQIFLFLLQIQVQGQTYNCNQYKSGCSEYCGGAALIDNFKCTLSETGQSGTHSCTCKSLPDLFQNLQICDDYKKQCSAICLKQGSPTKIVTPQVTCEPEGMNSMGFSCDCKIEDLQVKNSDIKCYNHLPESEGTCDDRQFWGSCEEWWMRSKYFCAETCNFCEWGAKQDYDCYEEYQNCQQRCAGSEENIQEFACYTDLNKNDCICKPGVNIVNNPSPFLGAVELPKEECYDSLPAKEGTCEQRVSWGSCKEYWMQENNYCARSCGYCIPTSEQQAPVPATPAQQPSPTTVFVPQEVPLSTLMSNLSLLTSPSPSPQAPLPPSPPIVLAPLQISVPAIVLPQQPNTPVSQVITEGTSYSEYGGSQPAQINSSTTVLDDLVSTGNEDIFPGRSLILDTPASGTYTTVSENISLSPQINEDVTSNVYQPYAKTSYSISQDVEFASNWVDNHNKFRDLHCVPGMSWDEGLYQAALSLSSECTYTESSQYGQNFYRASGYGSLDDIQDPIGYIVNYWYEQGVQNGFDLTNPAFLPDAGTTTQVIWKSSVQVGCAWKECADNWLYVNCLYNLPGNIVSDFESNIQPLC